MTAQDLATRYEPNPFQALAHAIILQAVNDYRHALDRLKRNPLSVEANNEATLIEKFLRSERYKIFTSVSGDYLIHKLRKEKGFKS